MTNVQALLAALHNDPGDHDARLALADALLEAGRADEAEVARLHARQLMRVGAPEELTRLCALLASGVRPVVPEVVNSLGMRLALIPAGTFLMGSPRNEEGREEDEPQHEVELPGPFYLGVFAVTQGEYRAVTRRGPGHFRRGGISAGKLGTIADTSRFPVECVSWEEAAEFCRRLTKRERKERKISSEQEYRLPSEAEWEYACRGGAASYQIFHFGDSLASTQANFDGELPYGGADKAVKLDRPCEVGSYPPNAFGLYDLHGNVREWCSDWYDADTYKTGPFPRVNPRGPEQGLDRVNRGGGWSSSGQGCRSACRFSFDPVYRGYYLGFRVSLAPPGG
jgi:uncharacterized protein (TIGR02996 family)